MMKIRLLMVFAASAACLSIPQVFAQNDGPPPGDRPGGNAGPGGERPGGFNGRRPMHPLVVALDKNRDNILSSDEIAGASAAIKSLDKNGDGQVTPEEMRPNFGGDRPGGDRPGGAPPEGDRPGAGGGDFIARLMEGDADKDGKLTKAELPERMHRILERADTSGDGALDKAELDAMAARFSAGRNAQGGDRPGGDRPGGNAPRPGGDRPQRPAFE
jgi:hypothetical protein